MVGLKEKWLAVQSAKENLSSSLAANGFSDNVSKSRSRVEAAATAPPKIVGALIHHWSGTTFIAGVTAQDAFSVLRDYDRYKDIYKPAIIFLD